ncbi:MAG TPA: hypothetical protein VJQ79_03215 [Acidimicrobiia bacterium]|nr:hypothetical protein [Acidimicrobiia bacterium]
MDYSAMPTRELLEFPLTTALFGRRSRRFGLGMEIPSGPLAFRSGKNAMPLSELEQALLISAATGVSGWTFGVPFGPRTPESHAEFTLRFTGRTAPTAAGLGTPALFFTDDDGCYLTRTRDLSPPLMRVAEEDVLERILETSRTATARVRQGRLDVPSTPPHILPPNLWWANRPGSTLFMPVGDASEECLGILALMMRHGVMVVDHDTGGPAGNLDPFVRSGLLDSEKRFPLSELLADVNDSLCLELAFMGHNIVLMLQAVGLGGLYFNGMDGLSALGAYAGDGVAGLGFRFVEDERWATPNPVGLEGFYEALCPPNYPDMHAAVEAFVDRKFGTGGAYDPATGGPWRQAAAVKETVVPYSSEFVDCLAEIAQYIYDKYGKFPGTRSTIMLPGFVQAHHLDTDFYDAYYQEGPYLETHARHFEVWHEGR